MFKVCCFDAVHISTSISFIRVPPAALGLLYEDRKEDMGLFEWSGREEGF